MTSKTATVWFIKAICGIRSLPVEGCPAGQAIFFANHSSNLDFVVLWAALPESVRESTRPVAARDYWQKSFLRRFIAVDFFNALLIERHNVTVHNNPLAPMIEALDAGSSLIIFPEGTRSLDGTIAPFKSGLFHLARARPSAVCVPIYLQNLNRILPKGDFLPVPLIASIRIGTALRLENGETKQDFLARSRNELLRLTTTNS